MQEKTVAQKGRIGPGTAIAYIDPIQHLLDGMHLPADIREVEVAQAATVLLFVGDRAALNRRMPDAIAALAPGATLWVCFRKGSRAAGWDMSRTDIWTIAASRGMRPLGLVSIDEEWSAFRLRKGSGG